jgi:hypothetical protein
MAHFVENIQLNKFLNQKRSFLTNLRVLGNQTGKNKILLFKHDFATYFFFK